MTIRGMALMRKYRIAPIMALSIFLLLLSFPVSSELMVPISGSSSILVPYVDWNSPVVADSNGALINLTYDESDSDVYWDMVWSGKWRAVNFLRHLFDDDICALSPVSNGHHNFVATHTQVNGQTGYFYICEHCGKSAGEVLESVYDDYVSELPSSGVASDGSYSIYPNYLAVSLTTTILSPYNYQYFFRDMGTYHSSIYTNGNTLVLPNHSTYGGMFERAIESSLVSQLGIIPCDGFVPQAVDCVTLNLAYHVPCAGVLYYPTFQCSESILYASGTLRERDFEFTASSRNKYFSEQSDFNLKIAKGFKTDLGLESWSYDDIDYLLFTCCINPMRFVPSAGVIDIQNDSIYNINTRSGSITGDYGIIGDNGSISVIENQTIVNETNNTYTNPATGTTGSISNWSYDYSDRSYNLTVQTTDESTGDTIDNSVSVTYGDESVTIVEGDTTYNIYYVLQQPEVEQPEHVHNYTGSITTQPGCTTTGVKTYTCSECNDTYTETLPALGHDWQIKTQVFTSYDSSGELVQQGYTIYKCSRCGEEYRSNDSVNPSPPSTQAPAPSSGSEVEISDDVPSGLRALRDRLLEFFSEVPQMFGELSDFLVEGWSYIPTEITGLLTFAISLVVLVGVFKLFWR